MERVDGLPVPHLLHPAHKYPIDSVKEPEEAILENYPGEAKNEDENDDSSGDSNVRGAVL